MATPEPWTIFRDIFLDATALVTEPYFRLPQYKSETVYRERVYCYELYHQFRCLQTLSGHDLMSSYVMHAEVDKSAHKLFKEIYKKSTPSPDFIVHTPGEWENLAVIEVKTSISPEKAKEADICKLNHIMKALGYQHGILLIFGENAERIGDEVREKADLNEVSILIHPVCGMRAAPISNNQDWK